MKRRLWLKNWCDLTFHATFNLLLKFRKLFISRIRGHSKNMLVQNDIFLNHTPSNITLCNFFHKTPRPFSFTKALKKWQILAWIKNQKEIYIYINFIYIYIYIYIYVYIYILYIYIHIYICKYIYINLQTAAVSLFESSLGQLRSNEDLEGPECSYHYYNTGWSNIYIYIYIYIYVYIWYNIYI